METFLGLGDTRMFAVINTTQYNNDGVWCITTASYLELDGLGFDAEEINRIDALTVGEVLKDFCFDGVIVIRIA